MDYKEKLKQTVRDFGVKEYVLIGFAVIAIISLCLTLVRTTPAGWAKVGGNIVEVRQIGDATGTPPQGDFEAIVEYKVAGQAYRVREGFNDTAQPKAGESRSVTYKKDNPIESEPSAAPRNYTPNYIIAAVSVFIGVAIWLHGFFVARRIRQVEELVKTGEKVVGKLEHVHKGILFGLGSKLIVKARIPNGETRLFESRPFRRLGSLASPHYSKSLISVEVYVDKENPDNYHVDIEPLKNITPDRIRQLQPNMHPTNTSRPSSTMAYREANKIPSRQAVANNMSTEKPRAETPQPQVKPPAAAPGLDRKMGNPAIIEKSLDPSALRRE